MGFHIQLSGDLTNTPAHHSARQNETCHFIQVFIEMERSDCSHIEIIQSDRKKKNTLMNVMFVSFSNFLQNRSTDAAETQRWMLVQCCHLWHCWPPSSGLYNAAGTKGVSNVTFQQPSNVQCLRYKNTAACSSTRSGVTLTVTNNNNPVTFAQVRKSVC